MQRRCPMTPNSSDSLTVSARRIHRGVWIGAAVAILILVVVLDFEWWTTICQATPGSAEGGQTCTDGPVIGYTAAWVVGIAGVLSASLCVLLALRPGAKTT